MSEQLSSDQITDSARLEWLIVGAGYKKAARVIGSDARGSWGVCDCSNGLTFMSRGLPTFRAAIDAAMEKYP